ncbi:MAG TPA: hypothetical protein PK252_01030 [Bacteroidales bacterium]|mgnify:CR=1 FL=1|nr:hypothetical protein [Bacteroidales bacterium]
MDKSAVDKLKKYHSKIAEMLNSIGEKNVISSIEKDIVLKNLREMYEAVLEIKIDKAVEGPVKEAVKKVEPVKIKQGLEDVIVKEPKMQKNEVVEQPKEDELIVETEPLAVKEKIVEQLQETHEKQQHHKQILAEKLAKPEPLLHDVVSQKVNVTDLSTKFQQKEIASLTQSIQINDRFLFIKELFRDDAKLYAESLQKIEEMKSAEEAVLFLKAEINIDLEKDAAQKLLQLINRKFANA